MRRKLFTVATVLSAMLCVAICGLWVSSYVGDADTVNLGTSGPVESRWISSESGLLRFLEHRVDDDPSDDAKQNYASPPLLGVRYVNVFSVNARTTVIEAPHWLLAALTAALPLAWLGRRLRRRLRRRREPGSVPCTGCGYDLRATRGRCPECGCVTEGAAARIH